MRRGIACAAALLGLLVLAPAASASFHLMKISELGKGGAGLPDYLELQMYSGGQNLVGGHSIASYQSDGTLQDTFTFPGDVAFGDNQRTILVARDDGTLPVVADFITPDLVLTNNGAACFIDSLPLNGIDCVAYGTFAGFAGGAPSSAGTPAPAPAPGSALHRSIAPGCATFLEDSDDTDDSATDFAVAAPSPRNNATAPAEQECDTTAPQTEITKGPQGKIDEHRAKFKFTSNESGSSFDCKFDQSVFKDCDSPKKYKGLDDGKHKFRVRATDPAGNTDPTPAKAKFKRVAN